MQQPSPSHIAAPAEFVGRSAELRWLSRSLADAQAGRPRVVVVVGEAGLGKSRLIEELSARARRAGTQVLSGRGEADLVLPHRLLGEALRPALEAQRAERPAETQLALSLLEGSAAGSQRSARVEAGPAGDAERWRAIQALEACVISMAQRRPLMICIDDLHWSDRPSLELLVRILHAGTEAARHAPLPLFIVCGSRPLEVDAALAAPLDRLEREEGVRVLELGGLSPDSVGQLMESAGLLNATRHLSTAVHELTRGNPLFVLEVARHLVHHGTPEGGPGSRAEDLPMPRSIGAALRDRLSSLSDPTRELLERAACMGERFELDSLARVAGRAAADLVDSLEEAQREGVLVAEGAQFAFAHPLLRHALHREAGDLRRYRLHLEIADSLSDDAPEPTGSLLLEIAHHLVRAGPLAECARVARVVRQAGDQASALWAPSEAAQYYAAALDAAPEDSPPDARAELHQRAGVACYRAVDAPGARGHFEQAVRAYQRAGDPAGVARARLEGMRVQITLEPLPYGSLAEVEPLEKALADLPDDEARLRGQIQQVLSGVYWTARQSDAAVRCARDAIAIARGLGDLHLESEARVALSLARTQTLELDEAIASAEAAVDAARAAQDAWLEGTALTRLPLVHFCRGDLAQAESVAAEAEECTRRSQDWTGLSVAVSSQLSIAAARGQLARARELAAELRRLAARSGYPWGAFGGLRAFVGLAFDGDEREEAEETLELLERPGGLFSEPGVTALVCWIYRQRMEVERGLRVDLREPLRAALRVQDSDHAPELGAVSALCGVILVARAMQEPALAEVPRHLLELSYARGVRLSSGWVYVLPRILGIAASLAGDADKAEEWFDDAESVASESGAAIELAHTCLDRARLLIERGDRAAAHRYALRARARFGELGFRNLERRAARLADAIESRSADPAAEVHDEWVPAPQPANSRTPSRFLREFLERLDADNEAPLGDVATERDAVILMTDMAGSTERIARRGERAALQVMQRHNAILRGCLSETGGVEVQHTGDGIFACFDDTHLAIVCAARMQQAFAAEAEGDGDPIAVRIGVSAGRVVPVEGRFFGSAVNLAARICAWASPGRIVVSGDVREQGDGAGFSFRDLGPTELKGFSDPMRLHEVVW